MAKKPSRSKKASTDPADHVNKQSPVGRGSQCDPIAGVASTTRDGDAPGIASARSGKLAEKDRSRLAAIMEGATAAIIVASPEGQIEHWNRGAEDLFGYSSAEALGRNVSILTPFNRSGEFLQRFAQLAQTHTRQDYETVQVGKGGGLLDVGIAISLIRDDADQVTGVCCMIRDIRERKKLQQQITDAAEEERQRLGRELHDSLSQQVSGISLLLATLKERIDNGESAHLVAKLEATVDQLQKQLRSIVKGLFPVDIDVRGLKVALHELSQEVERVHGITCRFECPNDVELADNFTATQLYMIAREAAMNAARHAQATEIVIALEDVDGGFIHVSVHDDGRGMPLEVDVNDGMGLRIMRHRCGLIGGTLTFQPRAPNGTTVRCQVCGNSSK